jgi:hypothetical protein
MALPALPNMKLVSSQKAAHVVVSGAGNRHPGFGRDDKGETRLDFAFAMGMGRFGLG